MRIRPNVHSFYNGIVHLYDTDIILSTLWGYIPLEEAYYTESVVTDFRRILYKGELMTFATFNEEHRRCLTFIKQAVADSDAKHKIDVTHHVPSFKFLQEKFKDSKANGAFTVELSDYIEGSDIDYWIYGHGSSVCLIRRLAHTPFGARCKTYINIRLHRAPNGNRYRLPKSGCHRIPLADIVSNNANCRQTPDEGQKHIVLLSWVCNEKFFQLIQKLFYKVLVSVQRSCQQ